MNFKKIALTGVLALVAVACGEKKEAISNTDKPVEIVLWEQMEPSVRDLYLTKVEEFNKANPNIIIKVTHYSNEDLRTQFQNASLAGQGPDLVYGPNDAAGIFEVSKLIKPLEEVISPELLKTFNKGTLESGMVSGKLYALPEFDGNNIALLYNKAMVKNAPINFDEFLAVAKENQKINTSNKAESTYGILYNEKEPFWFVGFYNGFGGRVFNDKNEPTLNNPQMVEALQFARDMRTKYGVGETGMDYDMADQLFKQGKSAMILNGAWAWSTYPNIDLGVSFMPLPNGKEALFYSASKGYSVSETVKPEKYAAINQFFSYIYEPKNNAEISIASAQVPAIDAARELPEVKESFLISSTSAMLKYTVPGPVIPEMRAVWDAMRPNLEAVINGSMTPEAAAKKMQEDALNGIKTIKGQ
ncbi:MAG: sugar ABC transporter substrate-binding protein [Fusobacteriaceae bacterium]